MLTVSNPAIIPAIVPRLQSVLDAAEGRAVAMQALERFDFYAAAKRAFAIIRTADSGPYGCFILKKGVVDLPPL
jgi:L-fucose mutarotase